MLHRDDFLGSGEQTLSDRNDCPDLLSAHRMPVLGEVLFWGRYGAVQWLRCSLALHYEPAGAFRIVSSTQHTRNRTNATIREEHVLTWNRFSAPLSPVRSAAIARLLAPLPHTYIHQSCDAAYAYIIFNLHDCDAPQARSRVHSLKCSCLTRTSVQAEHCSVKTT